MGTNRAGALVMLLHLGQRAGEESPAGPAGAMWGEGAMERVRSLPHLPDLIEEVRLCLRHFIF